MFLCLNKKRVLNVGLFGLLTKPSVKWNLKSSHIDIIYDGRIVTARVQHRPALSV